MKTTLSLVLSLFLLSACSSANLTHQVDLTDEQKAAVQQEIIDIQNTIAQNKEAGEPIALNYVDLARAYEKLGQMGQAIDTYQDFIEKEGGGAQVVHHNLGRLYQKTDQPKKAIAQYQILVDEFLDKNYMKDIALVYAEWGKLQEAEQTYNQWRSETGQGDTYVESRLRELREK